MSDPNTQIALEPIKSPTLDQARAYAAYYGPVNRALNIINGVLKAACRMYGPLALGGVHVTDKATVYDQMPFAPLVARLHVELNLMVRQDCKECMGTRMDVLGDACEACGGRGVFVAWKKGHDFEASMETFIQEYGALLGNVPNNSTKKLLRGIPIWNLIQEEMAKVNGEYEGVELDAGCTYVTGERGVSVTASAPDPTSNIIYGPNGIISSPIPYGDDDSDDGEETE